MRDKPEEFHMYTTQGRVRYSEVDNTGKITIPGIVNYFQDCSTFHSEDIGVGYGTLELKQKAWVLTSWQVIVERYVDFAEEITVSTFPTGFRGLYGTRNFLMHDNLGQRVAYANSIWVYMDIKNGRPTRPDNEEIEKYGVESAIEMDYADRKITVSSQLEPACPFPIRKYHIDTNDHVNNCQYIQMAIEVLPKPVVVKQVRVEYKKSAVYGDMIFPKIGYEEERVVVELCDENEKSFAIVEFIGEK